MSTRSYQRLAGDAEVIRIPVRSGERKGRRKPRADTSVEEETHEGGPFSPEGLLARKQKAANSMNPFAMGMVREVYLFVLPHHPRIVRPECREVPVSSLRSQTTNYTSHPPFLFERAKPLPLRGGSLITCCLW